MRLFKFKRKKKRYDGNLNKDSFPVVEAYTSLSTNLLVSLSMNDEKVFVVSSPEASEGKTTTSINLACSISKMGNKVLLIDADLRKPSIHKKLNHSKNTGLSNILGKRVSLDKAIVTNVKNGIDIIFSGDISPNPSEMLSSKSMQHLIEECREKYDYIVIDTPPINVVADACIVSKLAEGIVIVIKADETSKDEIRRCIDNIRLVDSNVLGVVINGVDAFGVGYGKKYGSKYGYKYGYRYGYSYGYSENKEKAKNNNKVRG